MPTEFPIPIFRGNLTTVCGNVFVNLIFSEAGQTSTSFFTNSGFGLLSIFFMENIDILKVSRHSGHQQSKMLIFESK